VALPLGDPDLRPQCLGAQHHRRRVLGAEPVLLLAERHELGDAEHPPGDGPVVVDVRETHVDGRLRHRADANPAHAHPFTLRPPADPPAATWTTFVVTGQYGMRRPVAVCPATGRPTCRWPGRDVTGRRSGCHRMLGRPCTIRPGSACMLTAAR